MPDMDGFEAAALIACPAALSAHAHPFRDRLRWRDATSRAYSLGAVDFIQTPVEPDILRAKIGVFADLFRKRAEVKRQAEQLREAEERLRHQAESRAARERRSVSRALHVGAGRDLSARCNRTLRLRQSAVAGDDRTARGSGPGLRLGGSGRSRCRARTSWRRGNPRTSKAAPGRTRKPSPALSDGEKRWLYVKSSPILADQGRSVGHVGIVEDVTARKLSEEQLIQADRRKDEFLAMLGHELRNPLAAIGNAVLVARTPGLENRRDWSIDVISRQVEQLSKLIDDLHGRVAGAAGQDRVAARSYRLRPGVEPRRRCDATARRRTTPADRDRSSRSKPRRDRRSDTARADLREPAEQRQQVQPERSRIHVSVRADATGIVTRVRDEGVGLEPGMAGRIFDLFVQAQTSLDRAKGGLGIGLSLARRLVDLHGGSIVARSEGLGRGSEFIVTLPMAGPLTPVSAGDSSSALASEPQPETKVLVVDDNVDAANALSLLLETQGFRVAVAHDGGDALKRADEVRPHIVLMDLGLPVLDGYQVASQLRARPNGSAVTLVAVSGYGPEQNPERASEAGFDHHLVKPIDCVALLALLAKSTRLRATRAGTGAAMQDLPLTPAAGSR